MRVITFSLSLDSTQYVLGIVLHTGHMKSQLIFAVTHPSGSCYYPCSVGRMKKYKHGTHIHIYQK